MTCPVKFRPAYDPIRPVTPSRHKKPSLSQQHSHGTTPSALQKADKPNPWPVALILIIALLAMGFFWWGDPPPFGMGNAASKNVGGSC